MCKDCEHYKQIGETNCPDCGYNLTLLDGAPIEEIVPLQRIVRRLRGWGAQKRTMRACREARKRVSAMTEEECSQLWNGAMKQIFPGGWWACANEHPRVCVAKGTPCRLCAAQEESSSAKLCEHRRAGVPGKEQA